MLGKSLAAGDWEADCASTRPADAAQMQTAISRRHGENPRAGGLYAWCSAGTAGCYHGVVVSFGARETSTAPVFRRAQLRVTTRPRWYIVWRTSKTPHRRSGIRSSC